MVWIYIYIYISIYHEKSEVCRLLGSVSSVHPTDPSCRWWKARQTKLTQAWSPQPPCASCAFNTKPALMQTHSIVSKEFQIALFFLTIDKYSQRSNAWYQNQPIAFLWKACYSISEDRGVNLLCSQLPVMSLCMWIWVSTQLEYISHVIGGQQFHWSMSRIWMKVICVGSGVDLRSLALWRTWQPNLKILL